MNNETANDTATLRNLGLNPGLVDNYSDVSAKPISFTNKGSLGWGSRWEAVHSGFDNITGREIEIDGAEFSAEKSVSSYEGLFAIWARRND